LLIACGRVLCRRKSEQVQLLVGDRRRLQDIEDKRKITRKDKIDAINLITISLDTFLTAVDSVSD
jgi:uncharacterized membrane protein YbaN (DUF454 family)